MPPTPHDQPDARFDVKADATTHFAWLRTRLALERTLMAWVRTATSLIAFGFTIFQFFERLNSMEGVVRAARPQLPRYLALALIGAGTIGLIISLLEYRWALRYLWSAQYRVVAGIGRDPWNVPIVFVAVLLTLIGVVAFAAVLLRIH